MATTTKPNTTSHTTKDVPDDIPGYSTKFDYVLDWIRESAESRRAQNGYVDRAIKAYQGEPSRNRYKGIIKGYVELIRKDDTNRAKSIERACSDIPDKKNMTVQLAVETVVSMAQGGVGRYEFGPTDPYGQSDSKTIDRLSSATKHFYDENKVDSIAPQYIRNAVLCGDAWMHLKNDKGKKCISLLDSSQMLTDPKRFKINFERFIGHHQRDSWKSVKSRVTKAKGGGYIVKTINAADVYVDQITRELNSVLQQDATATYLHDELRKDLDIFYKPVITRIEDRRKQDPEYQYNGDDVEISFMYDKMNDMYFEVINRRYIIVAKKSFLKREIQCGYYDAKGARKTRTKTVELEDPYVELPYIKNFWDTYPVSPLFYVLDDFDDLCAMESVLYHNLSIMAPITFIGQSSDAEKVSRISSISGEIVEGLPQTFGVLDKTHDITPIVTAIQRNEERIKRVMKAVDPFELQAMIGDRATAKEVVSASGQVSQGINPFIANIETAFSVLGEKFIKMEIIFGDKETYSFEHNGEYGEVTREEMSYDYNISAKLSTSIKLEQEANSRKALELEATLGASEAIDKKQFHGTMIPIILTGLVSKQQAENMVLPEYRPMPEEVIAAIRKKAEVDAQKDDVDKLNLDDYDDAQLQQIAQSLGVIQGGQANPLDPMSVQPTDMDLAIGQPQPPTVPVDPTTGAPITAPGNPVPLTDPSVAAAIGSPEQGGLIANDQAGLGYV